MLKMSLPIKQVGYIGLGIMGAPAARNILAGGYALGVWARRAEVLPPFTAAGATAYATPAELAAAVDVVITNLSDTPDVEGIILGELQNHLRAGAMVVDMSTIAPAAARQIAQALAQKQVDFLDAPVSGGEAGAKDGTLTFMVGGTQQAFARAEPLLKTMGRVITHIGGAGAGQVAKACNQIIIGATLSGISEAFQLARAYETDLTKVRAALLGGFASSRVLEVHAQRMISGDYAPGFKARLHHKDIKIAMAEAEAAGIALPSADIFLSRLAQLIASGDGDLDSAAIAKLS